MQNSLSTWSPNPTPQLPGGLAATGGGRGAVDTGLLLATEDLLKACPTPSPNPGYGRFKHAPPYTLILATEVVLKACPSATLQAGIVHLRTLEYLLGDM